MMPRRQTRRRPNSLDRTYEELKRLSQAGDPSGSEGLDRTYEELKLATSGVFETHDRSLDCTYEELKHRRGPLGLRRG